MSIMYVYISIYVNVNMNIYIYYALIIYIIYHIIYYILDMMRAAALVNVWSSIGTLIEKPIGNTDTSIWGLGICCFVKTICYNDSIYIHVYSIYIDILYVLNMNICVYVCIV